MRPPTCRPPRKSGETGRYTLHSLRPGNYRLEATLAGFKKQVQSGITLQVNQTARLDLILSVGDVAEQVTVAAEVFLARNLRGKAKRIPG
ncbi:MAG: carboxypeptidase regulatory-like domain-containing protein [Acidobacteriia bacterium]|nr:carboxypeptidase regulatory-like domain-containing protein [Terriglobia bacterium]